MRFGLLAKLALRNILGAGLRTWLNVFVLSAAFVMIIWAQGIVGGMSRAMVDAKIDFEAGGGQYWQATYDPYDPLTFEESHSPIPQALNRLISRREATPILITTGAIYPRGQAQAVVLYGMEPGQTILNIPTQEMVNDDADVVSAMIGAQTARETGLRVGDYVTVRWRDVNGTFDAGEVRIEHVVSLSVPGMDRGQMWLPIEDLQQMLQVSGQASLVVLAQGAEPVEAGSAAWIWHDLDYLLKDIEDLVEMKSSSSHIIYSIMLLMGLLAIFDTQVLAIWRRRKEIGTLIALGLDRARVIWLFTLEGAMHGVLALVVGAAYGIPILALSKARGFAVPEMMSDMGMPVPQVLYPVYGARLVLGTTLLVLISVTIVSGLPASRIAKLNPTHALRGKRR
ncbi:MAG: FtsX-like permease family protein [bacterium]|jgi:ABC-type lipoprotein release transport system permease subunit